VLCFGNDIATEVAVVCQKVPTSAEVGVNAHIARRSRQTFVLTERDVLLRRRVDVFFGKTEVNDVNDMLLPVGVPSNQEVLGLDVPVDELLGVDIFYPRDLHDSKLSASTNASSLFLSVYQRTTQTHNMQIMKHTTTNEQPIGSEAQLDGMQKLGEGNVQGIVRKGEF